MFACQSCFSYVPTYPANADLIVRWFCANAESLVTCCARYSAPAIAVPGPSLILFCQVNWGCLVPKKLGKAPVVVLLSRLSPALTRRCQRSVIWFDIWIEKADSVCG